MDGWMGGLHVSLGTKVGWLIDAWNGNGKGSVAYKYETRETERREKDVCLVARIVVYYSYLYENGWTGVWNGSRLVGWAAN